MTPTTLLPKSSFSRVTTHRLARPNVLWQHQDAAALGFDATRVFCMPVAGEALETYTDETRVEWADRYGGVGVGGAGGSGRCSSFGGLQTKGVGPTPLVAHDADVHHSSGTQTILHALVEVVFASVFQDALPFGAVPTLAVLMPRGATEEKEPVSSDARALTLRPFVLRPAHFMRNVLNQEQRQAQGASAPGLTRDAYRVAQGLKTLPESLRASLNLQPADDLATIDAGLRELTRRFAWQFAANFAKRLPHGSVGCSNVSLSGQFLDYGMSHFVPAYRRPADAVIDPWTEGQRSLQTVLLMRQQLDKYYPGLRGAGVAASDELARLFGTVLEQRLAVEMAKMAGLTEDLADICPPEVLADLLQAMRPILIRGGKELLAPPEANAAWRELPIDPMRPDLNRMLIAAARCSEANQIDRAIAPLLSDAALRGRFVAAYAGMRLALRPLLGGASSALDGYLAGQARRKNAMLPELERDSWFRIRVVVQMLDENFEATAVQSLLDGTLRRARYVLSDLSPDLADDSGCAQIQAIAQGATAVPPDMDSLAA